MAEKIPLEDISNLMRKDFNNKNTPDVYTDEKEIYLQFWGWALILKKDGTWFIEDTSGG